MSAREVAHTLYEEIGRFPSFYRSKMPFTGSFEKLKLELRIQLEHIVNNVKLKHPKTKLTAEDAFTSWRVMRRRYGTKYCPRIWVGKLGYLDQLNAEESILRDGRLEKRLQQSCSLSKTHGSEVKKRAVQLLKCCTAIHTTSLTANMEPDDLTGAAQIQFTEAMDLLRREFPDVCEKAVFVYWRTVQKTYNSPNCASLYRGQINALDKFKATRRPSKLKEILKKPRPQTSTRPLKPPGERYKKVKYLQSDIDLFHAEFGSEVTDSMLLEVRKFPLFYRLRLQHASYQIERKIGSDEANTGWMCIKQAMHRKYPHIPSERIWRAWRSLRMRYGTPFCPIAWVDRVDFLDALDEVKEVKMKAARAMGQQEPPPPPEAVDQNGERVDAENVTAEDVDTKEGIVTEEVGDYEPNSNANAENDNSDWPPRPAAPIVIKTEPEDDYEDVPHDAPTKKEELNEEPGEYRNLCENESAEDNERSSVPMPRGPEELVSLQERGNVDIDLREFDLEAYVRYRNQHPRGVATPPSLINWTPDDPISHESSDFASLDVDLLDDSAISWRNDTPLQSVDNLYGMDFNNDLSYGCSSADSDGSFIDMNSTLQYPFYSPAMSSLSTFSSASRSNDARITSALLMDDSNLFEPQKLLSRSSLPVSSQFNPFSTAPSAIGPGAVRSNSFQLSDFQANPSFPCFSSLSQGMLPAATLSDHPLDERFLAPRDIPTPPALLNATHSIRPDYNAMQPQDSTLFMPTEPLTQDYRTDGLPRPEALLPRFDYSVDAGPSNSTFFTISVDLQARPGSFQQYAPGSN